MEISIHYNIPVTGISIRIGSVYTILEYDTKMILDVISHIRPYLIYPHEMKLVCKSWREYILSLDMSIKNQAIEKYGDIHMDSIIHSAMLQGDILLLDLLISGYSQPLHVHPISIFMLALDSRVSHPKIPNVLYPLMRRTYHIASMQEYISYVCIKFNVYDIIESLNSLHYQYAGSSPFMLDLPVIAYHRKPKILPHDIAIHHSVQRMGKILYNGYDIKYAMIATLENTWNELPVYVNLAITNILLNTDCKSGVMMYIALLDRVDILVHILSDSEWKSLASVMKLSWKCNPYTLMYMKSKGYCNIPNDDIDEIMYPPGWRLQ